MFGDVDHALPGCIVDKKGHANRVFRPWGMREIPLTLTT